MPLQKEPNGRRSVTVEVEVPGTPGQVWQAIATGPGISSWFVPATFEVKGGTPVAVTLNFGPGMESTSSITRWEPGKGWATRSEGWVPGMPDLANEWSVESRGGGLCVVRIVQSLFAETDDWDDQLRAVEYGWPGFLRTLRLYLAHFAGQAPARMNWMTPVAGTEAEAWDRLTAAVGLTGAAVGQTWTAPAGVPAFGGVVEHFTRSPYDALLRIDRPAPGIASLGTIACGGPVMVAVNFTLFGDRAAKAIESEKPTWDEWIGRQFPAPAGE